MKPVKPAFAIATSFLLAGLALWVQAADEKKPKLYKEGETVKLAELKLTTLDGKVVTLDQFKNKGILLNFFATWCAACNQEAPELETKVWQKFKDRPFVLLACTSEDDALEGIKAFREEHKLSFPVYLVGKHDTFSRFATNRIPWNAIIDPKGKLLYSRPEWQEEAIVGALDKCLPKPKPKKDEGGEKGEK